MRDCGSYGIGASADDNSAQPPAQLVGEAPPRARESLRALIVARSRKDTNHDIVHLIGIQILPGCYCQSAA
jgi:hypothetical protein